MALGLKIEDLKWISSNIKLAVIVALSGTVVYLENKRVESDRDNRETLLKAAKKDEQLIANQDRLLKTLTDALLITKQTEQFTQVFQQRMRAMEQNKKEEGH